MPATMKTTLTKNLRRAFRAFELAVAVTLLMVMLELVLIQLNHPRAYPYITPTENPIPMGTQVAGGTTNAALAAPLQMAVQPAAPKAAHAPNAPVRPAPAQPPQPTAPVAPANPPSLLSFHYVRQHVRNFAQFNFFPASPASPRAAESPSNSPPSVGQRPAGERRIILSEANLSTTNELANTTNHVQFPNNAGATNGQTGANHAVTRTNHPAGATNDRPGTPVVAQLRAPDLRSTNGMFRLAIP